MSFILLVLTDPVPTPVLATVEEDGIPVLDLKSLPLEAISISQSQVGLVESRRATIPPLPGWSED